MAETIARRRGQTCRLGVEVSRDASTFIDVRVFQNHSALIFAEKTQISRDTILNHFRLPVYRGTNGSEHRACQEAGAKHGWQKGRPVSLTSKTYQGILAGREGLAMTHKWLTEMSMEELTGWAGRYCTPAEIAVLDREEIEQLVSERYCQHWEDIEDRCRREM